MAVEAHYENGPRLRAPRSQARGRERRAALLRAASEMLHGRDLDEISLQDLARAAGIPTASAYHFYSSSTEVFASLAAEIGGELGEVLALPISPSSVSTWEDVVQTCADRTVAFYAERPDARQLLIGSKAPAKFKHSDRDNDQILGTIIRGHIETAFELPAIPQIDTIIFHCVEIADLFYSLSMLRNGSITPQMAVEAVRASVAYMRTYLPAILPVVAGASTP